MARRYSWALLFCVLIVAGCASWFMKGARMHKGAPAAPIAVFHAPNCRVLADGSSLAGPEATYYLVQGRGVYNLLELDGMGSGSAIENYWLDQEGHHFATYVRGRQAWHYVLPDDRTKPGMRYVYTNYQVVPAGRGFRISGSPMAECAMNPDGMTPPAVENPPPGVPPPPPSGTAEPPPAPSATQPPPPATVCTPGQTQECIGPGACAGGQACRDDGTGFGPCDCGDKE